MTAMGMFTDFKYMLEKRECGSGAVLELMEGLEDHRFELYTDNHFTSPKLFLTLYTKGVNSCGTARTNKKGSPKALVKKRRRTKDIMTTDQTDLFWQ